MKENFWTKVNDAFEDSLSASNKDKRLKAEKRKPVVALMLHLTQKGRDQLEILREELEAPDVSTAIERLLDNLFEENNES